MEGWTGSVPFLFGEINMFIVEFLLYQIAFNEKILYNEIDEKVLH